ncbi:unnamed protein product [Phaeothamnion confervicola]
MRHAPPPRKKGASGRVVVVAPASDDNAVPPASPQAAAAGGPTAAKEAGFQQAADCQHEHGFSKFEPTTMWISAHGEGALWACISARGNYLASCGADGTAVIWYVRSANRGFIRLVLPPPPRDVVQCTFSPDEEHLVVASGDVLTVWLSSKGILRHTILVPLTPNAALTGVDWSPDGSTLASCSSDAHVCIWGLHEALRRGGRITSSSAGAAAPDGALLADLSLEENAHTQWVTRVAFAPNGKSLLTCSQDKAVKLWVSLDQTGGISSVGRNGDGIDGIGSIGRNAGGGGIGSIGRNAGGGGIGSIGRNAGGGSRPCRHLCTYRGHRDSVTSVAWNSQSTLFASGSADRTVVVWRPSSTEPLHVLRGGHQLEIGCVCFCHHSTASAGCLVSCGRDRYMCFFDVTSTKAKLREQIPTGSDRRTTCVSFHTTETALVTASAGKEASLLLWRPCSSWLVWWRRLIALWRGIWFD